MTKITGPSTPTIETEQPEAKAPLSETRTDETGSVSDGLGNEQVSEQYLASVSDDLSYFGSGDLSYACNGSSFGCTVQYQCSSSFGCPNKHDCGSFTET